MREFSKIFEESQLVAGQYKELKKIILDKIQDKTNLKVALTDMSKGFDNQQPIPFTTDELHDIWKEQVNSIDAILASANWFEESPSTTGIKSTMIYMVESTKKALKLVCDMLISEQPK